MGLSAEHGKQNQHRTRGVMMLILATFAWGCSFPLSKGALLVLAKLLPDLPSWSHASLLLAQRFAVAALMLGVFQARRIARITPGELRQGLALGIFASFGSLLQTDGLYYTGASTSAFLTQFTCVLVPTAIALQRRRFPHFRVIVSCITVLVGVAILSGFSPRELRLGRGEAETLLCAVFFTGQILCLEVTRFHSNDPARVTLVMFATVASILFCVAAPQLPTAGSFLLPLLTPSVMYPLFILVFVCTLFAFGTMTKWQRVVGATEAGLIYCLEPLSTSAFTLFLPALISQYAAVAYANEPLTASLLIGGTLITAGNILILLPMRSAVGTQLTAREAV